MTTDTYVMAGPVPAINVVPETDTSAGTIRHIQGLPGELPPGEHIIWQGAPSWRSLLRHMCHGRAVATYLAVLIVGAALASVLEGDTLLDTLRTLAPLAAAALAVAAFLCFLCWAIARTTEYTITTARVVIRFGIALPAALAIPHRGIARASVRMHPDGSGDLPLLTRPGYHVRLHRTWPHARPWHWWHAQPMLRSIPDAGQLAPLLARTLAHRT